MSKQTLNKLPQAPGVGRALSAFGTIGACAAAVCKAGMLLVLACLAIPGFARAEAESDQLVKLTSPDGNTFWVVPRKPELNFYPCAQCHEFMTPDPEIRQLFSPHPSDLDHGDERIWCLTCHKIDDRNSLTNLLGESIDYDRAADLCASCHMQRHNDWMYGGHGKRRDNWQGERVIYSCPHCHDPHSPPIESRPPKPLPPVRKGLEREVHAVEEKHLNVWERLESEHNE